MKGVKGAFVVVLFLLLKSKVLGSVYASLCKHYMLSDWYLKPFRRARFQISNCQPKKQNPFKSWILRSFSSRNWKRERKHSPVEVERGTEGERESKTDPGKKALTEMKFQESNMIDLFKAEWVSSVCVQVSRNGRTNQVWVQLFHYFIFGDSMLLVCVV